MVSQELDNGLLIGVLIYGYFLVRWARTYLNGTAQPPRPRSAQFEGAGAVSAGATLGESDASAVQMPEVAKLKEHDRSFDEERFLEGAKCMYECIVVAFADADMKTLARHTSADVYSGLAAEIVRRSSRGEASPVLVMSKSANIVGIALAESATSITVRFEASYLTRAGSRAADGADEPEGTPLSTIDEWTFARKSTNANWTLVSTQSG